jgi:hypothetical protein
MSAAYVRGTSPIIPSHNDFKADRFRNIKLFLRQGDIILMPFAVSCQIFAHASYIRMYTLILHVCASTALCI